MTRGYFEDNDDSSQQKLPLCGYYSCFFGTSEVQISARSPAVMTADLLSCYQRCITFPFARHITLYFPGTYFDHYCHPEGCQEDPKGDKYLGGKRNYITKDTKEASVL